MLKYNNQRQGEGEGGGGDGGGNVAQFEVELLLSR